MIDVNRISKMRSAVISAEDLQKGGAESCKVMYFDVRNRYFDKN